MQICMGNGFCKVKGTVNTMIFFVSEQSFMQEDMIKMCEFLLFVLFLYRFRMGSIFLHNLEIKYDLKKQHVSVSVKDCPVLCTVLTMC